MGNDSGLFETLSCSERTGHTGGQAISRSNLTTRKVCCFFISPPMIAFQSKWKSTILDMWLLWNSVKCFENVNKSN